MEDLFKSIGLGFPQNESQLENFNRIYAKHSFKSNEEKIDPHIILKKVKSKKESFSQVGYHKRLVLAGEIAYQLRNENTIGHLKLQKLIYLCQNASNISLPTCFLKQANGPFDPRLMRSIDKGFLINKWFKYSPGMFPIYQPLENCGGHKEWYDRYFNEQSYSINYIISLLKTANKGQVELVATIFACWLEAMEEKTILSNELIIRKVYAWSSEKQKFEKDQIVNAINWMREKNISPKDSIF